jgi:hypothetical protein
VRSVLAIGGNLSIIYTTDVFFVLRLSKWGLVFQLVGVLAVARAMESQFLPLAWGSVFAGKRELKGHSLII